MIPSSPQIILASGSPRRRELLGGMGVRFEVVIADVRELDAASAPHLTPARLAEQNAFLKAKATCRLRRGHWILGADTVVSVTNRVEQHTQGGDSTNFIRDRVLGKPASLDEARTFLRALSGRTHDVITGCTLISPVGELEIFHETTHVTFLDLSDETIARYLDAVPVLDKAGAYALQEHGDWIIDRVEGSRTNVIGLPTELLQKVLFRRGLLQT